MQVTNKKILIIACGALAQEIVDLQKINGWNVFDLQCIPAQVHNYPEKIPGLVKAQIDKYRDSYEKIFIGFADCGTGGLLDKLIKQEGVERLPGAHCYAFFSGLDRFEELHEEELGTLYLTDFFVKHFDTFFTKLYNFEKYPELKEMFFGNYKRVVYLAQTEDQVLVERAKKHAEYLGLEYMFELTNYGELENTIDGWIKPQKQKVSFQLNT